MKFFFKGILLGVILVVAGAIGFSTYLFNAYTPRPVTGKASLEDLAYFQETYEDCRRHFLEAADKITRVYQGVQINRIRVDSRKDVNLTIDHCYIPARKSFKRLLILTSGIHGIEGYTGSAVQQMFLTELAKKNRLDDGVGVLVIHGMNPYGFKYKRRVSENNVDLNRNCGREDLFQSDNPGYNSLNTFLNKRGKVNLTSFDHFFFQIRAVQKILTHSIPVFRQAILQGQYQFPRGIFFGGTAPDPPVRFLASLIQEIAHPYDTVLYIGVHTGYGANGTLHLLANPLTDKKKTRKIETLFSGTPIDWGGRDEFYTVTGDFATYVGEILPQKETMAMAFEFGTLDTQTTMGSIKALHNLMIENQGFLYGYTSEKDRKKVESRFIQGYYPSSRAWRSKAIQDARHILFPALNRYGKIEIED